MNPGRPSAGRPNAGRPGAGRPNAGKPSAGRQGGAGRSQQDRQSWGGGRSWGAGSGSGRAGAARGANRRSWAGNETEPSARDDARSRGDRPARDWREKPAADDQRARRPPRSPGRGRPRGLEADREAPSAAPPTGTGRWGSVARHGVRALQDDQGAASARSAWREAAARAGSRPERWEPDEVWVVEPEPGEQPGKQAGNGRRPAPGGRRPAAQGRRPFDEARRPAGGTEAPGERGGSGPSGHRHNVPQPVVAELAGSAGNQRGAKLAARLADASHAYERERYEEARRILRPLAEEVPGSAAVQELYGLVLYRSGQWAPAARHLETYRQLSGSTEQHPVLADCYRALHRYEDVEALWDELREASPSGEVVAEGRIVAAGARADRGDLAGAISLLERVSRRVNRPQDHHVRQWYVLADLYERAGDIPRARELFARIDSAEPGAFDVRQRLRALR